MAYRVCRAYLAGQVCQAGQVVACPGGQDDPGEAGRVYPAYRVCQAFQGAVDRADPDGAGLDDPAVPDEA